MKKKKIFILALLCGLVSVCTVTACQCGETPPDSSIDTPSDTSPDIGDESFAFDWKIAMPNGIEYQNVTVIPSLSIYERCTISVTGGGAKYVSNTPAVATVSDLGVVSVISTGEASITVTVGENSQTITFTANNAGNVPTVSFNASNVLEDESGNFYCNVMQGRAVNTGVSVKYNGINYTDVMFTYISSDSSVATFTDGRIEGKKEGTATLTVSANAWREYTGKNLSQTITVSVRPDLSLNVAQDSVELYMTTLTEEITSFALAPVVAVNSVVVENASFTYSDYDDEVISVSANGTISAVGEGTTELKISYTTVAGATIEKLVNVTVTLPVAVTTLELELDKTAGAIFERETFNMLAADNFKRVEDVETGKKSAITADGVSTLTGLPSGVRDLVVYTDKQGYKIKATVVDKVIMTAEDMLSLATDFGATTDWFTYEGYFILGRNIDFNGATVSTGGGFHANTVQGLGFSGTFDGMGHTISNVDFREGGLFGKIENATIKNLAITNVTLSGPVAGCFGYTLNNAKIDNVFVDYAKNGTNIGSSSILAYRNAGASELTNILLHINSMASNTTNQVASLFTSMASKPAHMENVYVITNGMEVSEYFTHTQDPETKVVTAHKADFDEVYTYTSVADFKAANHDLSSFNAYWDITGDYPTFKAKATQVLATTHTVEMENISDYTFASPTADRIIAITIGGASVNFTVASGQITLPYSALSVITGNDYELVIDTETVTYVTTISLVTKVIHNAEELRALATDGNLSGYYVLGGNIENLGVFTGLAGGTFTGVFDGRGYAISGVSFTDGVEDTHNPKSLLGNIASNATVKNLAIINSTWSGIGGGVLANSFVGECRVENVFIALNDPESFTNSFGVLAFKNNGTLNAKNVITYFSHEVTGRGYGTFICTNDGTIVTENCYSGSNVGYTPVHSGTVISAGVTNYNTKAAMVTAYKAGNINIFAFNELGFKSALVDFLSE